MNAKKISFVLMMGALGNVLFAISFYAGPIAPGVNLDFSLIAAFIAGFYGGPTIGFASGLLVGVLPGIMFGPLGMGGVLGLIGLPFGKALSGLTAGLIAKGLKYGQKPRSSLIGIPSTYLAYVPEAIFTYAYFILLLGTVGGTATFFTFILPKALVEVTIISVVMAALMGNKGFSDFARTFARTNSKENQLTKREQKSLTN